MRVTVEIACQDRAIEDGPFYGSLLHYKMDRMLEFFTHLKGKLLIEQVECNNEDWSKQWTRDILTLNEGVLLPQGKEVSAESKQV